MTEVPVRITEVRPQPTTHKAGFVRQLIDLRKQASDMNLHRVVICLDYAHWEFIAEARLSGVRER